MLEFGSDLYEMITYSQKERERQYHVLAYRTKLEKALPEALGPPCGEWHSDRFTSPKVC